LSLAGGHVQGRNVQLRDFSDEELHVLCVSGLKKDVCIEWKEATYLSG